MGFVARICILIWWFIFTGIMISYCDVPKSQGQNRLNVIISEHSTKFAWRGPDHRDRAHNVALAAQRINGYVIRPGEVFSYNDVVGPRTTQRGFRIAHVIVSGDLVDGLGGGVCQVSSTLHAAVLLSGLAVVESHPHSRALPYIAPSLDSTVAWGSLDFKFRNDFGFAITISASTMKGELNVQLLGLEDPYEVMLEFTHHKVKPYKTQRHYVSDLSPGVIRKKELGSKGYDITRTRTIWDRNGVLILREQILYHYEPSDRVLEIGW